MQRNSIPLAWRPKGVSDTIESSQAFSGAMAALTNLIPDPTTAGLWQCRPAATKKVDFFSQQGPFSAGFDTGFQRGTIVGVGTVSVFKTVGNILYGMIGSTVTGTDLPIAYNLVNNVFYPVTGVAAGNTPLSLATAGDWTPPTMDLVGSKLIVTHLGFGGTAFFFGWFDISIPTAPVWHAGNLTGAILFTQPPSFVAQFGGRAYYIVNVTAQPAVVFSDVLNPTNVFAATQVLTFGDLVPLTALGQLRLYNQLGGIIQSLIVFKGSANMYQITGDAILGNLAVNAMNVATGTKAPNAVCSTPKGLAFVAPDGLRIIDYQANISDPIGLDGNGIVAPFIYSSVPSRMCAACAGNIIRLTTQNSNANGSPQQEYWFDLGRKIWSGPHTFASALIQPWAGTFLKTPVGVIGAIWQSDPIQSSVSTFVENGAQLTWTYSSSLLPDTDQMTNFMVSQATLDIAFSASSPPIAVSAVDQNMKVFDSVSLSISGAGTIWGAFNWGAANWGAPSAALAPRQLQWHRPLVFARLQITATGQSATEVRLGALHLRYKALKYLVNLDAVA